MTIKGATPLKTIGKKLIDGHTEGPLRAKVVTAKIGAKAKIMEPITIDVGGTLLSRFARKTFISEERFPMSIAITKPAIEGTEIMIEEEDIIDKHQFVSSDMKAQKI